MLNIVNFIKDYHPMSLNSYKNINGELAIGWNRTFGVYNGLTCTKEEAERYLKEDINSLNKALAKLITVKLTESQK